MSDKILYTFTLEKEIEVEKQIEEEVNGEKVKVTRKVKEKKPIAFALKRPNRRMYEKADMFYGVTLADGIRAGLLTKALLLKRYRNDGGALSEADTAYFSELATQLNDLENKHQRLLVNVEQIPAEDRDAQMKEIVAKKMGVLQSLQALESVNQALFSHTAETKAQVQLTNWWIVHLAMWDKEGNEKWEEFFPGDTFDKKMEQWDSYDDERSPFVVDALARFALLVGLWLAGAQSKEDFTQGEKEFGAMSEKTVAEIKEEAKAA